MTLLLRAAGAVFSAFWRAIRWTVATVEEQPSRRVPPLPGRAHGPVYAIDVRLGRDRRRV